MLYHGSNDNILATTTDAGRTWRERPLQLPPPSSGATPINGWSLHALDASQAWLVAKTGTSSNFSRGLLYQTRDGGATWIQAALPAGEPVIFLTQTAGWTAGGANGAGFWQSHDGGSSWRAAPFAATGNQGAQQRTYVPLFSADGRTGVTVVATTDDRVQRVDWFVTRDGGGSWQFERTFDAGATTTGAPDAVDARAWLIAESGQPVRPSSQAMPFFGTLNLDDSHTVARLAMATATTGWAVAAQDASLWRTRDGGKTWRPLTTPWGVSTATAPSQPAEVVSLAGAELVSILRAPGFDTCEIPPANQLATWFSASPYRAVNLYIGGALRACSNQLLSASFLRTLTGQGWRFIPTWVGPQAPCSEYAKRFSLNPTTANAEGHAEALAAVNVASQLGLTFADKTGTILYYDLESFDGEDSACVAAARAFVAGWVSGLHESGNRAGLYGSACNPRIAEFANNSQVPDAIWAAQWTRSSFDPQMTVWGIACLDDTLWSRSQRIRQYTGGHDETYGGVTFNIDSNVLDAPVADLTAPPPQVTVETPELVPAYGSDPCKSGWMRFTNARNQFAYLTRNRSEGGTVPPPPTPRTAIWVPNAPLAGFYRVEVYLPEHGAVEWPCPTATLGSSTASAHYTVYHTQGATYQTANQTTVRNGWLSLGIYPFMKGQNGSIVLSDLTDDPDATRMVLASAVRLTYVPDGRLTTATIYLPELQRNSR
ncbi:MAG: DUF1906 domain-containing protein [Anaerolineales bacterium]|nr:DUF1906 domain-containing protein [Anaerolineales bacterium]